MMNLASYSTRAAFLIASALVVCAVDLGLTCKDHPASDVTSTPVLIRSWIFFLDGTALFDRVVYNARFDGFEHEPVGGSNPDKYKNLGMFYANGGRRFGGTDLARLYFQRPALVYLVVNAAGNFKEKEGDGPVASLPGWKSEGWALRVSSDDMYEYGVQQKNLMSVGKEVYVFSKTTSADDSVVIPQFEWIEKQVKGISTSGMYHVRIAEADGKASKVPAPFRGITVKPNEPCPEKLHDAWSAMDENKDDSDTKGVPFGSWHPQWDPCYWCAYDHEHGSAAPYLMNYIPKYGYTARKNDREIEKGEGFKDFVVDHKDVLIYISLHAQTSDLRRLTTRNHTVTLAVKKKGGSEMLAELTFKADFGFRAVRGRQEKFLPLTPADAQLQKEQQDSKPPKRALRSINVINEGNLAPEFSYNDNQVGMGVYEEWITEVFCASAEGMGQLTFDLQDPITGIKTPQGKEAVFLGTDSMRDVFLYNTGIRRTVRTGNLHLGASHCGMGSDFEGGEWYTDVYGRKRDGPGRDTVRQYIKPGFTLTISGKFVAEESNWLGLYKLNAGGAMQDHGYGIDFRVN